MRSAELEKRKIPKSRGAGQVRDLPRQGVVQIPQLYMEGDYGLG